jgi:hypothetical protein
VAYYRAATVWARPHGPQDYYHWAVRWTRTQQGLAAEQLEELTVFRAEAEELLKQESGAKSPESERKQKPD